MKVDFIVSRFPERLNIDRNHIRSAAIVRPIAVTKNFQILFPVLLISWTFMPKSEEASVTGMKMNARMVTAGNYSAES